MRVVLVLLAVLLLILAFAAGFVVHGLVLRQLGNDVLNDITTSAVPGHPGVSVAADPAHAAAPNLAGSAR